MCWEYGGFEDGGAPGILTAGGEFCEIFFLRDFCDRPDRVGSVRWGRPLFGGVTVTERWNPVRYPESTEVKR